MAGSLSSIANPSGVQGACPTGWHLPSDPEWMELTTCLGGEPLAGGKLKETGTAHWDSPNTGATNESGFTALPGGYRHYINQIFDKVGYGGYWWSATENDPPLEAWNRVMLHNENYVATDYKARGYGFSVRCVKDN